MKFSKFLTTAATFLTATRGVAGRTDHSVAAWQNPSAVDGRYGHAVSYIPDGYSIQAGESPDTYTGYGQVAYTPKSHFNAPAYTQDTGWPSGPPPRTDGSVSDVVISSLSSLHSSAGLDYSAVSDETVCNDKENQERWPTVQVTQTLRPTDEPPSYCTMNQSTLRAPALARTPTITYALPDKTSLPYSQYVTSLAPTQGRHYGSLAESRFTVTPTHKQASKTRSPSKWEYTYSPPAQAVERYEPIIRPWDDQFAGNQGLPTNGKFDFDSTLEPETPLPTKESEVSEDYRPLLGATCQGPLTEYYVTSSFGSLIK